MTNKYVYDIYFEELHLDKDKIVFEKLIQFLQGSAIKLFLFIHMLDASIKLSWNFLFFGSKCHLSGLLMGFPVIITASPSPNLTNEKGILQEIKDVININSFS